MERERDLSLDVRDLGSVYLGGTASSTLVLAGHIRAHRPDAAGEHGQEACGQLRGAWNGRIGWGGE